MKITKDQLIAENTELKGVIADQQLMLTEKDRFISEGNMNYNELYKCFDRLSEKNKLLETGILKAAIGYDEDRHEITILRGDLLYEIGMANLLINANTKGDKGLIIERYRRHNAKKQ